MGGVRGGWSAGGRGEEEKQVKMGGWGGCGEVDGGVGGGRRERGGERWGGVPEGGWMRGRVGDQREDG